MANHGTFVSIPAGLSFVQQLAEAFLDGSLAPELYDTSNQLALAGVKVYLPTRRAARAFHQELLSANHNRPTLLPQIFTLGDPDETLTDWLGSEVETLDQGKVVSPQLRRLQIARLVKQWLATRQQAIEPDGGVSSNFASAIEAMTLADELCELMDQSYTEEIDWQGLGKLVSDDYAHWWSLTLEFLKIATKAWPQYLAEKGCVDAAQFRRKIQDDRTHQVLAAHSNQPIICAGSTGSIPATARFIRAVAKHPKGCVVLPGLDQHMADQHWDLVTQSDRPKTEPGHAAVIRVNAENEDHAQFGLANLLGRLNISRNDVRELGKVSRQKAHRMAVVSQAMLPSTVTDQWINFRQTQSVIDVRKAFDNVALLQAANEREEAHAIALCLKKARHDHLRAALVCSDRRIAQRVGFELKKFGILVDDSAGKPLRQSFWARYLKLLIATAQSQAKIEDIAACINHPLLATSTPQMKSDGFAGRLMELALLRGLALPDAIPPFEDWLSNAHDRLSADKFAHPLIREASDWDWRHAQAHAANLDLVLRPLRAYQKANQPIAVGELIQALEHAFHETLKLQKNTNAEKSKEVEAIQEWFDEVNGFADLQFSLHYQEFGRLLDRLLKDKVIRSPIGDDPNIAILGPLEARLQNYDYIVLGGLNEGAWPQIHANGPFLNRPMKQDLGLSTPERRTGLAAHDFWQLIGTKHVVLSRSLKMGDTPSIASRWVQRLLALVGEETAKSMQSRGHYFVNLSRKLGLQGERMPAVSRPCPKPPIYARPQSLWVSDIEKWIRDPYALYAKHILGLKPLKELGPLPEPIIMGNIIHDTLAEFVASEKVEPDHANPQQLLQALLKANIEQWSLPKIQVKSIEPDLLAMVENFMDFHRQRKKEIHESLVEIDGRMQVGKSGFILKARADRLDVRIDGAVDVWDYKTGSSPTVKQAKFFSPQLLLEAAMVGANAFASIPAKIGDAGLVRLGNRTKAGKIDRLADKKMTFDDLVSRAKHNLCELIEAYQSEDQGYVSRFAVRKSTQIDGDYDHLARVLEWSVDDGGDDEMAV